MLSLILTYRNRDLIIVKPCLDSLAEQSNKEFQVFLVDYGSDKESASALDLLCKEYNFIHHIYVPVQDQLWNKSRAINIALKRVKTSYSCIADIDLLFHPEFVEKVKQLQEVYPIMYFKTGFLTKGTGTKNFLDAEVAFSGNKEVTGISLYDTEVLKSINGYDEFYHGWGAEDTDVHLRLKNAGYHVYFYDKEILLKHQWHSKTYRSRKSTAPFHTRLEKINHHYMLQNERLKLMKANKIWGWGIIPSNASVESLEHPVWTMELSTQKEQIDAFLSGVFPVLDRPTAIKIVSCRAAETLKNRLKKYLRKKYLQVYDIETVNNSLLSGIITHHRLASYKYHIDWEKREINLILAPYGGK